MTGDDPEGIRNARRRFFDRGQLPADQLNHAILRSWMRCAETGLDPHAAPTIEPLTSGELKDAMARHDRLRRLARPELDALNQEARETGAVVLLTTAEGLVLDTVGDAGFAGRAAEVALQPGAAWSEASAGTNAIGTALAERRAVSVHGDEHFFEAHQGLSCATAPILDPRGVAVGALDLSCPASLRPVHALGLVRLAAEQIERRLFEDSIGAFTVLRLHSDPALLDSERAGALLFDGERLVGANRRGLSLVSRGWESLDAVRFEDLFAAELDRLPDRVEIVGHDGSRLQARVQRPGEPASASPAPAATLEEAETQAIRAALAAAGGNVSKAARQLGVHRSTLYRRFLGER
ncbi:MAG: helix-turn-helix domain-containing protein [Pseudomonadota bacterium]